jgi:hypothetical protein
MDTLASLASLKSTNGILAIIAVAAAFIGLALEYVSIFLYSDREGSFAVSIVGAGVVALGIASEYGLHLESSEIIISRMQEMHCEINASQQKAITEIAIQAAPAKEHAASADERTGATNAEICKH